MHKMVTMETNGDLMVKMLNSVGYTPDKYLLGLKYVKSSVYYILLKNALTSHFSLFWDPTISDKVIRYDPCEPLVLLGN